MTTLNVSPEAIYRAANEFLIEREERIDQEREALVSEFINMPTSLLQRLFGKTQRSRTEAEQLAKRTPGRSSYNWATAQRVQRLKEMAFSAMAAGKESLALSFDEAQPLKPYLQD